MSGSLHRGWSILLQTIAGASRSLPLLLVSCLWILVSSNLPALVDANNNGFSDLWEEAYNSGELFDGTFNPQADPDGDGWTNAQEAAAGTDPFDPNPPNGFVRPDIGHVPAVIGEENGQPVVSTPEAVTVSWLVLTGKQYTLLYSPDLSAESWMPVGQPFIGTGGTVHYGFETSISDKYFWRVAVCDIDTDGDGFNDWEEHQKRTDPLVADRDDDGLPDAWEILNGLDPDDDGTNDPNKGPYGDTDSDGLLNIDEFWFGTNPRNADTDADELTDSEELYSTSTSPILPDTDGDGISDGQEDSDRDGLTNLSELRIHSTYPWNADSDDDTLRDGWEIANGLDPLVYNDITDPDGDGLTNAQEQRLGLAPLIEDTDHDGTLDGAEDPDNDSLPNLAELNTYHTDPLKADTDNDGLTDDAEINIYLTNPTKPDTDADGMPDGWEIQHFLNAKDASGVNGAAGDPDNDGLSNFDEWLNDCDPNDFDTDGDGTNDGVEVAQGSNPNDPSDGGNPPPSDQMIEVPFTVSDPSDSHSEKWKMSIKGRGPDDYRTIFLTSPEFGEQATATKKLRKLNRYEISVSHIDTDPEYLEENDNMPDYDWEATVDSWPNTTSVEEFAGVPGVNKHRVVKDHWIVDNRQAVFTGEKHGNDNDIVTGHTAMLIPAPIERDKGAADNNWETITAQLAKALPGQKMNLKLNQSRLPSGIVLSGFQWTLPPPVFKNWTANQQNGTLTQLEPGDLNQPEVHFYFTNSGAKTAKISFNINGEPAEINVTLDVQTPTVTFNKVLGSAKIYTNDTGTLRAGLTRDTLGYYYGITYEGSIMLPAGWPQGKWNWVQTGTPNITATTSAGNPLVFATNGQTGVDTTYPFSFNGPGSHPGDAFGYPTGVTSYPGNTYGDTPSIDLTNYRDFSYASQFTTWLMFLAEEEESRYVPMQSMDWKVNFAGAKNPTDSKWSLQSSPPGVEVTSDPHVTTIHPKWTLNIAGAFVSP